MEIIVEIVLQVLVGLLEFLAELLLSVVGEVLVEWMGHSVKEPLRRPRPVNPWLAALGYSVFGAGVGLISLWLLPTSFITSPALRIANLMLTPLASGAIMALIGRWRERHNQELIRLDQFSYGFCFALSMALVRFVGAE